VSLIILDTDAASAVLRNRTSDRFRALTANKTICITFVTLGELTKWTLLRSWGPRRLADFVAWCRKVVVLPYNTAVATTWGEIQARAQHRGRPRPVNDSWIAACALVYRLPLITFNLKDFADFAQYDGLDLVDLS
jgi:predicted nucleic acid-binding protein